MTRLFFDPFFQAEDSSGNSIAGATLTFYETGTTTPKNTYSDSALTTPNANPVVAIGTGRFPQMFLEAGEYTVLLKDSDGVTLDTMDNYSGVDSSGDLLSTNNLSDVASAATSRTNLAAAGTGVVNTFTATQTWKKGADIPSAGTVVLGTDGNSFDITGTTGITGVTVAAGTWFQWQFDDAVALTHSATFFLNNAAANYTTAAGDILIGFAFAANSVRAAIIKASGAAVAKVALADLADGTDGELFTWDASGNPAKVPVGTASEVLTSNGPGAAPTFQAAAGGGGAWNIIGTAVASGSGALTVTGLDSTYDTYAIGLSDLVPASDDQVPWLRMGDSGGVDSGGTDYEWRVSGALSISGTTWAATGAQDDSDAQIDLLPDGVGNAAGEGCGGMLFLHRPGDGASQPTISGDMTGWNTGTSLVTGNVHGARRAVITLDRIQFLFASGNIATGRLTVWGIAHA